MFLLWFSLSEPALIWDAALEGCPDAETVMARLPTQAPGVDYDRFVVRIDRDQSAWVAHVQGQESREIRGATCEELADAVVLLVELSMQQAEEASVEQEPEPESLPAPLLDPQPDLALVKATRSQAFRPRLEWGLALVGGATFVVTPTVAPGFDVYAGPRGRHWAVDLGAIGRPLFHGAAVEVRGVSSDLSAWLGLARACGVPGVRKLEFPLCAGVEAGALIGRGRGDLDSSCRHTAPWIAARVEGGLRIDVHPLVRPTLWVTGIALLARPQFSIEGAGRVCCDNPVGISAGAGVEFGLSTKKTRAGH